MVQVDSDTAYSILIDIVVTVKKMMTVHYGVIYESVTMITRIMKIIMISTILMIIPVKYRTMGGGQYWLSSVYRVADNDMIL